MGPGLGPFFAHDYRGANQNGPNMVTVKTIHFLYLTHETIHFSYCSQSKCHAKMLIFATFLQTPLEHFTSYKMGAHFLELFLPVIDIERQYWFQYHVNLDRMLFECFKHHVAMASANAAKPRMQFCVAYALLQWMTIKMRSVVRLKMRFLTFAVNTIHFMPAMTAEESKPAQLIFS